jgi:hypothetical protein
MFKRLMVFAVVLALSALALAPAAAQDDSAPDVTTLTQLAQYFPDDTPFFGAWRIDDAYIGTLDTLLARFAAAADVPYEQSLFEALDQIATQLPGGGAYRDTLGAWLGDTVAVGALSLTDLFDDKPENDSETPLLAAFELDDADRVTELLTFILTNQSYTVEETETYTLLLPPENEFFDEATVMITQDALFIANGRAPLPTDAVESTLAALPAFSDTLAQLPEATYNGVFYLNTPIVFETLAASPLMGGAGAAFETIEDIVVGQGFGFTILGDDSLVMDIVQPLGDTTDLQAAGFTVDADFGVIDPAFARFIPADTSLVLHGVNLRDNLTAQAQNFQAQLQLQQALLEANGFESADFDFDAIRQQITTAASLFEGATGLDPVEDVLAWMDGDFALVFDVSDHVLTAENASALAEALPVDFGIIIDAAGNADAAAATVSGIGDALAVLLENNDQAAISQETMGGSTVYRLTAQVPDLERPVEILIGSNDQVLAFGTERFVRFALNPDGGLESSAAYQDAQTYLLPGAVTAGYVFDQRLQDALGSVAGAFGQQDDPSLQMPRLLLSVFGQSSISAVTVEQTVIARGVLTLPIGD